MSKNKAQQIKLSTVYPLSSYTVGNKERKQTKKAERIRKHEGS